MPQRIIMSLKNISLIVGIVIGVLGAFQSYAILPYRTLLNEKKIEQIESKTGIDHDLLIQIAQDIKYLKERMK